MLVPPLDGHRRIALLGLTQPAKHDLPVLDGEVQIVDGAYHSLEGAGVSRVAEGDDLLTGTARGLPSQARVAINERRSGDVGAGEKKDVVAVPALAKVESASTFKMGSLQGRD